jgi:hypothetical protein
VRGRRGGWHDRLPIVPQTPGTFAPPSAPTCSQPTRSSQPPSPPKDGDYGWGLLLRTLSDILQHDRRPQLGEASLDVLFALLSRHSAHWDDAAWRVLLQRVLRHMLALPPGLDGGGGAPGGEAAAQQQHAAVARAEEDGLVLAMLRRMDRYFPLLCEQIGFISDRYRVRARRRGRARVGWRAAMRSAALLPWSHPPRAPPSSCCLRP